jgi:hypothetical protein
VTKLTKEELAKVAEQADTLKSITYDLKYPFRFGDDTVERVVISRPKYGLIKKVIKASDDDNLGALELMLENCAVVSGTQFRIMREMFGLIDAEDMGALHSRASFFLKQFGEAMENESWLKSSLSLPDGPQT